MIKLFVVILSLFGALTLIRLFTPSLMNDGIQLYNYTISYGIIILGLIAYLSYKST
jgi:hypothetical protein